MSQNRNRHKAVWDLIQSRYTPDDEPLVPIRSTLAEMASEMSADEFVSVVEQEQFLPNDVYIDTEDPGHKFPGITPLKSYVIYIHHTVPSSSEINYVGIRPDSVKVYLTSQYTLRFIFDPIGEDKQLIVHLAAQAAENDDLSDDEKKLDIINKIIEARELYNSLISHHSSVRNVHHLALVDKHRKFGPPLPEEVFRRVQRFTKTRKRGGSRNTRRRIRKLR